MDRQQMIEKLEQYRQSNGTYDVPAIIRDEQPEADSLGATFAAFFGDGDEDRPAEDSPLVALARELNEARGREQDAEDQAQIDALIAEMEAGVSTPRRNAILNELVGLGAGFWDEGDDEQLTWVWQPGYGTEYDDQGGLEENAGRPTWGGFRPGSGRPPRQDGRSSRIVRVAATDEELEAITAGTDPDSRRAALLERAAGYSIAGQPFKRSLAQYRQWIGEHGETYPDMVWHLAEAIVSLKVLRVHQEERYHALVVRYGADDIEAAERVAAEYMHQRLN